MAPPIRKTHDIQVRQVKFLPQDLSREPNDPPELIIEPGVKTTLTNLFGQTAAGGKLIGATAYGALQVAIQGVSFVSYDTKADTAPASYSSSHQLAASAGVWHRFDILVETQEASIRFWLDSTASWGDDIPLTVGNHSMEFESSIIQIKKRGTTAGTYTIVGWQ